MNNFRYRLMQFFSGRYGADETFIALIVLASVLAIINCIIRSAILQTIVYTIVIIAVLRSFSRNFEARRAENEKVKRLFAKFNKWNNTRRSRAADRTHVYKKCPACHAVLRLPRRKGTHSTVCPRCNRSFKVHIFKA